MSNYHARIMNIPVDDEKRKQQVRIGWGYNFMYKIGHRDARHSAAEIAMEADQEIERYKKGIRFILTTCETIHDAETTAEKILNGEEIGG